MTRKQALFLKGRIDKALHHLTADLDGEPNNPTLQHACRILKESQTNLARVADREEAVVERMAAAIEAELSWPSASREFYRDLARLALTAAQEGEAA